MDDIRHRLGKRKQLARSALGLGPRRERLVQVDGIDAILTQRVFGNSEADFDELDVLGRVNPVLLQKHVEWPLGAATNHGYADSLALEICDGFDWRILFHRPID